MKKKVDKKWKLKKKRVHMSVHMCAYVWEIEREMKKIEQETKRDSEKQNEWKTGTIRNIDDGDVARNQKPNTEKKRKKRWLFACWFVLSFFLSFLNLRDFLSLKQWILSFFLDDIFVILTRWNCSLLCFLVSFVFLQHIFSILFCSKLCILSFFLSFFHSFFLRKHFDSLSSRFLFLFVYLFLPSFSSS